MRVLIVGGSGYLGQFLVENMLKDDGVQWVGYTYNSKPIAGLSSDDEANHQKCKGYQIDVSTGEGTEACITDATKTAPLDLVVNCAAISSPGQCEKDEKLARDINVPSALIAALSASMDKHNENENDDDAGDTPRAEPLLIHLSTDQVYSGEDKMSTVEGNSPAPINAYGRSKVAAEEAIRMSWPNHVILRSSIITGPAPPLQPVNRPLMTDFIVKSLNGTEPVTFFEDEYRCPICVYDIVSHVRALAAAAPAYAPPGVTTGHHNARTFNMGGPDRTSRVDMARRPSAATVMGLSDANVVPVPAASVDRGVASPPDISMDSSVLTSTTGVTPRSWEEQVRVALALSPAAGPRL